MRAYAHLLAVCLCEKKVVLKKLQHRAPVAHKRNQGQKSKGAKRNDVGRARFISKRPEDYEVNGPAIEFLPF